MYRNILIAVALDHDALVERKLALARYLLADDGQITLLTVLENIPGFVAEFVTVKMDNALTQRVVDQLRARAGDDQRIGCEVMSGKPGIQIVNYAREHANDLILVGSHHPSAQDYFLGSTASRVVRRAECSVFVVRDA